MSFMMCVVAVIWSSAILAGLMPLVGWNKYIYEVGIMGIRGSLQKSVEISTLLRPPFKLILNEYLGDFMHFESLFILVWKWR